jgi:hypothetical protein
MRVQGTAIEATQGVVKHELSGFWGRVLLHPLCSSFCQCTITHLAIFSLHLSDQFTELGFVGQLVKFDMAFPETAVLKLDQVVDGVDTDEF